MNILLATLITACVTLLLLVPSGVTAGTSFASSCDAHFANTTTPSRSLTWTCQSSSVLPFTQQTIAVWLRARPLNAGQAISISLAGSTSGGCYGDEPVRFSQLCGSGQAKVSCEVGGYTTYTFDTYCVTVKPLSGQSTSVSVDIEYTPASESAQWHLKNTGQFGGTPGVDVNAEGAWNQGAYGNGVVVLVVDQGVQAKHGEVQQRFVQSLSWNPQTQQRDPTPTLAADTHGTSCAGVVASAHNNICGQGMAFQASLAGVRIFGNDWSADVAGYVRAMYQNEVSTDGRRVSINSNSWGSGGCQAEGCTLAYMVPQVIASIQNGADTGRNGLGVVYVFSAGNDGHYGGDSNMRTYNKLPEVICVAASDFRGQKIYYSNSGANLFVNAPSRGQQDQKAGSFPGIITAQFTTFSTSLCKGDFGGTSSACPLVSGVIATILGARSDLLYRDVQHIVRMTADRNDAPSSTWLKNGAGIWYSHIYGFGRINAGNAVSLAKKWIKLGNVTGTYSRDTTVNQPIYDNSPSQPVTSKYVFASHTINLPATVEHVMVYITINHKRPKDLRITLSSPYGTRAQLALPQLSVSGTDMPASYPLAARVFWGESPVGIWTISVSDEIRDIAGTFTSWAMEVTGNGTSSSAF